MNGGAKAYLAEFVGTFVLVFLGSASVALAPIEVGPVMPALAHGLALMFAVYAFGHISGGHVNSAVTIGVTVAGGLKPGTAVIYIVTQIVAAIAGAFVLTIILPGQAGNFGAFSFDSFKTTTPAALLLEAILAFILVSVVLQAAVAGKAGPAAGLAIGLTLTTCILAGGPITGASVNPARTLGPAIIAGNLSQVWVYVVGTSVGGAVAGLLYRVALKPT